MRSIIPQPTLMRNRTSQPWAGMLSVRVFDERLPAPEFGPRGRATEAQSAFGRGASLAVATREGREIARAGSLERGVPTEVGFLAVLPGSHVVTYAPPGGPPQTTTVDVSAGARVDATLGTPPVRRRGRHAKRRP